MSRRLAWLGLAGCLVGCGGEAATPAAAADGAEVGGAVGPSDEGPAADPLLAKARASIREGRVDPKIADAIVASEDSRHARAARLLAALAGDLPAPARTEGAAEVPDVRVAAAPDPADDDDDDDDGAAAGGDSGDGDAADDDATAAVTAPHDPPEASPAKPTPSRPSVDGLSLAKTGKGGTLTISAPGGVTVGVANQLSSGIVHLVLEGAGATAKVIGARPSIAGAKVTAVRRGQKTVQITLDLEPGWTLGRVTKFSGGAKVQLKAPP